ncbi:MAG: hypothetical protein Q8R43_00415, partial [Alphaproteobacteria bacterium]|nr:hypothetical protein [Alphaproteobacteria bacterium]
VVKIRNDYFFEPELSFIFEYVWKIFLVNQGVFFCNCLCINTVKQKNAYHNKAKHFYFSKQQSIEYHTKDEDSLDKRGLFFQCT